MPLRRGWNVGGGLTDIETRVVLWLEDKLICSFKLTADVVSNVMLSTLEKPVAPFPTAWMGTGSPPQSVALHKQSHKIPFQDFWSVSVLHKLPEATLDRISHQFEITYKLLPWPKCSLTPPPTSTPALSGNYIFSVNLICCTADEEHSVPENYTYISFYSSLYVLTLHICAPTMLISCLR